MSHEISEKGSPFKFLNRNYPIQIHKRTNAQKIAMVGNVTETEKRTKKYLKKSVHP